MRRNYLLTTLTLSLLFFSCSFLQAELPKATIEPLVRAVDLNVGQTAEAILHDGSKSTVTLLELDEKRDSVRNAVRKAQVKVKVNGQIVNLVSSAYNLPVTVGDVQIDCPIMKGYLQNSSKSNAWGLVKDARIRLWPAGSPWVRPGTFLYPAGEKWFASDTQMANVPCYVDGGELPSNKNIYYHYGLDFGGSEGLVEAFCATDGLVVSAAGQVLDGYKDTPVSPRYDVVYIMDGRGWFYRYSHLSMIATPVFPGQRVTMGQRIGLLGKEGGSGGWSHLHFDISSRQPSGLWGTQNGYAFIWQVYQEQFKPDIIAVARPHHLVFTGERVGLDGSRSWSRAGGIESYEWTFCDGRAKGARVEREYSRPGEYSEILRVRDSAGNIAYDFAVVQVIDRDSTNPLPPAINANYYPTFGLRTGDEVTFKVRSFRTQHGEEVWDFGDGTSPVSVKSDGNVNQHDPNGYAVTTHRYRDAGDYIVTVKRSNQNGHTAIGRLHVRICVN